MTGMCKGHIETTAWETSQLYYKYSVKLMYNTEIIKKKPYNMY